MSTSNDLVRRHEEVLLGNAMETILGYQDYIPRITEYQFQRDVLELLKNPFDRNNLIRYQAYCVELVRPLNVVSTENQTEVLFQIPALFMSPRATIPTGNGLSAENFFQSLKREYELGGKNVNEKIAKFMMSITSIPNYRDQVILPLRAILQRYGTDFDIPGVDLRQVPQVPGQAAAVPPAQGSSFGDEYED